MNTYRKYYLIYNIKFQLESNHAKVYSCLLDLSLSETLTQAILSQ